MVKRLTAVLFVLLLFGQAYAGLCPCLGDGMRKQHACCNRQKLKIDSMRAPNCCDTDCIVSRSEKVVQYCTPAVDKTEFKIIQPAVVEPAVFRPTAERAAATALPKFHHRLKYPRPADLFVQNCAFLI